MRQAQLGCAAIAAQTITSFLQSVAIVANHVLQAHSLRQFPKRNQLRLNPLLHQHHRHLTPHHLPYLL